MCTFILWTYLIDVNSATSELANPGISTGLNFSRSRSTATHAI